MSAETRATLPVSRYAIVVGPKDNVAVVKQEIAAGTLIEMPDGRIARITGVVTPGHRFATRKMQ